MKPSIKSLIDRMKVQQQIAEHTPHPIEWELV